MPWNFFRHVRLWFRRNLSRTLIGRRRFWPRLEVLEDRIQPATILWGSSSSGNWNTATNWVGGVVPGANDTAVINQTGITVTYSSGTDSVQDITSNSNLNFSGGDLIVSGSIQVASGATLTLQGGTLSDATISAGTAISAQSGTLDGVKVNGNWAVTGNDSVTVTDGLTLNGMLSLGNTTTIGYLNFSGSETLGGTGSIGCGLPGVPFYAAIFTVFRLVVA